MFFSAIFLVYFYFISTSVTFYFICNFFIFSDLKQQISNYRQFNRLHRRNAKKRKISGCLQLIEKKGTAANEFSSNLVLNSLNTSLQGSFHLIATKNAKLTIKPSSDSE